jgi:hypothetical protein
MTIYFSDKEKAFFNSINEELIEDVVKQFIVVYKISAAATSTGIYGSSSNKTFEPGIKIWSLITILDPEVTVEPAAGIKQKRRLEVTIQKKHLLDNSFYFDEGDYLHWDSQYFEIQTIVKPQFIQGQPDHNWHVKLTAESAGVSEITIEDRDKYDA